MEGIIVGVDESTHARAALRWAVDHASYGDEPVTAVMAWGYFDQHHTEPGQPFMPDYCQDAAAMVLADLVVAAVGEDHEVRCMAVNDLPAAALRDAAKDASMLVVGARGMGGFRGLLLGSVSRQALHDPTCPVAIVHDDASRAGKPIIVGVDGSESSQRALAWAVAQAGRHNVRVVAVHAWQPMSVPNLWYPSHGDPDERAARAASFLDAQLARLDTSGVEVERRCVDDRPTAALLEAGTLGSLIVVGSRGHGQLASAVLGSVSDQVAHHATCPVVVVP